MSVFDNVDFLPGVITEVQADYSFGYDTSLFGTTDSVVIIGTAFSGPVGKLIPVYSPDHATYLFGKTYDNASRREATLVAGVQDAWDRGCRTIYAMRVSGKTLFKDFDLCIDANMKLRIQGSSPANTLKDCYMLIDTTAGNEKIRIYKPASKATIEEKMQGMVEHDNSVMVVEILLNQDYGLGRDSRLVEVIRLVNEHGYNNVLQMLIVNEAGVDVTNSVDAYNLEFGALFPGVYFVGRNASACPSITTSKFSLVMDDSSPRPFSDFDGLFFKNLIFNSDVSQPYPIYANNMNDMKSILRTVEVTMIKDWDFLETAGVADRAFVKDSVDYEEANISKFDIYKNLGSGFAITAKAERRVDGSGKEITPRIKETPMDDTNRIAEISDGIYSMLENANIKYRVIACGAADDVIANKLPRPEDFLVSIPESITLLDNKLIATAVVDRQSQLSPKAFNFRFEEISDGVADTLADIYTDKVIEVIPKITTIDEIASKNLAFGTLCMLVDTDGGHLKRIVDGGYEEMEGVGLEDEIFIVDGKMLVGIIVSGKVVFKPVTIDVDATTGTASFMGKEYVLGENNDNVYVFQVVNDPTAQVKPLGDLKTMLNGNPDKTLVYFQNNDLEINDVIIRSAEFAGTTIEELADFLNNQECIGRFFQFEVNPDAIGNKDDMVTEVASAGLNVDYLLVADRTLSYDYNLYIPYKTTDNFARQLAQHCTFTELKTGPAHGIIGVKKIMDVGLANVARRVKELVAMELDLYAKNKQGRNMLDKDNLPYPVGKNLSVTFMQYMVTMSDGYKYVSDFAGGYAGMVSKLPLDQSSTNQPVSIPTPMIQLNNYQLGQLTDKGIITVKQSLTQGNVVTDGITMAPASSAFRRLGTTRIINGIEELIRAAAEPYIGKVNSPANRNAMQTAIKANLDKTKDKLIQKYTFNMIVDPRLAKFNIINIDYAITPLYEIKEVRNRIAIKDQS